MTLTDLVVFLIFVYFFYRGYRKGLFAMLIPFLSLSLSIIAAYIYFLYSDNLFYSILIAGIGPFAFFILFSITNYFRKKAEKKEEEFRFRRIFAGLLSLGWKGSFLIIALNLLLKIPFDPIQPVQQNVEYSITFNAFNQTLGKLFSAIESKISDFYSVSITPEQYANLEQSENYEKVNSNVKVQAAAKDPEVRQLIEDQRYLELTTHPKIRSILTDPELVKEIISLNKEMNHLPIQN